ncbi:Nif3-like dinuclear metal center hexameric protein [Clostridium sp.]|uniref:Nif3-like dinuclear metal center hexameric protein n=1 Tax=Clostridium sp. TaxID=1506 RepID=UPI001A37554F|nr:Nif3-like dinuclear metal center hexameric protein [Clostridium sp.]MBK5242356.1 Nif3-like dinuclear metal center hexameric protein [Clostridium sp.]
MILKVETIHNIMEEYAPAILSEDYDNVGLMVGDRDAEVTKILIALDCTIDVIREAVDTGCNFILTHHPLLFNKPKSITSDTLIGKKIIELIKNNIALYASHTNLDSVKGGLNDIATEMLGFNESKVMESSIIPGYDNGYNGYNGIGRLVTLDNPILLIDLCEKVKKIFNAKQIRYVGEDNRVIKTIAIINGSGEDFFEMARKFKADCIITGDTKYHGACDLKEQGTSLIDAGHFITEWIPFQIFGKIFRKKLRDNGYCNEVLISKGTVDTYKFI